MQTEPVNEQCDDLWTENVPIEFMNCCNDVEDFRDNKCSECDGNNPNKWLLKKFETQNHNYNTLINTNPNPNEESLRIQVTRFPQSQV